MLRRNDIAPGTLGSLAVVIAVVAIMVPTCVMVGCTMSGGMMYVPFSDTPSVSSSCGGTYVYSKTPVGVMPADASTLIAFVAALLIAVAFVAPRLVAQGPVRALCGGPPPPPDDLGGVRLLI